MRLLVATGIEKLDNDLLKALPEKDIKTVGNCCHQSVIEKVIEETCSDHVLISPALYGETDIVTLIRRIRERGLRVIVLPGSPSRPETKELIKELVPLGIYDFVYDKVTIDAIVDKLLKPGTLGDIPKDIREVIISEQKFGNEIEKQIDDESNAIEQGYSINNYTDKKPEQEQQKLKIPSLLNNVGKIGSVAVGTINKALQRNEQKDNDDITEDCTAENYLCQVININTRKQKQQFIVCVISPRCSGVTFVSTNLAYLLSEKYQVSLVGGNDCCEYLGSNNKNISISQEKDSACDVVIYDTHTIKEADLYILVYSPDIHYIDKIKEYDMAIDGEKLRVVNRHQELPISYKKLLGFKPDVIIDVINNSRQILLSRPAVIDYSEIKQSIMQIVTMIERDMLNGKNAISKPAVFS